MPDTITRAQLIEVAERTINEVGDVPQSVVNELMAVARTAPRVTGTSEWWEEGEECGCLVGTLLHRSPNRQDGRLSDVYWCLGVQYLGTLDDVVPDSASVLTVVEE